MCQAYCIYCELPISNDEDSRYGGLCERCATYDAAGGSFEADDEVYLGSVDDDEVEPAMEYDDSMDGDHDSAMTSAGWGTDEDYNHWEGVYDERDFYGEE